MRDCEVFAKEILQRYKSRVYTMANAPMAEEIVKELKKRGHNPALVKLPSVQYIALTLRATVAARNITEIQAGQALEGAGGIREIPEGSRREHIKTGGRRSVSTI